MFLNLIMIALAFAILAFFIYLPFSIKIKNEEVLGIIRIVIMLLWLIASCAYGFNF